MKYLLIFDEIFNEMYRIHFDKMEYLRQISRYSSLSSSNVIVIR